MQRCLHISLGPTAFLALWCCLSGLLLGCEESVDPILEANEAYSFYGFFDADADTQAARIFPVATQLLPTLPEPLDAQVTSTDLMTGETIVWQDSVAAYLNGTFGHVFFASFQAQHGHTYQLQAQRADGATTTVQATMPSLTEPDLLPPETTSGTIRLPVFWPDAPRILATEAVYHLKLILQDSVVVLRDIIISYAEAAIEQDGGWLVEIDLTRDARTIFDNRDLPLGSRLFLLDIELRTFVTNREWFPPGGRYDPDLLVQPGTFTNVTNGFGFMGAGYRSSLSWLPDADLLDQVGLQIE